MEVYFFQPCLNIETRTRLLDPWKVSVTDDFGIRIVKAEAFQKFYHATLLGFCTGIGRSAGGIQTAFVTNADAVGVVMLGVGTNHLLGTARVDFSILGDVVVVADGAETTSLVTDFKVFNREIAAGSGGRAMNDDKVYFSHVA